MKKRRNKNKIFVVFLLVVFMAFSLAACTDDANTDDVNAIALPDVTVGDTFEIELTEPYMDGGWRWAYEITPDFGIEYVSEKVILDYDDPDLMGSSGISIQTFRAVNKGQYEIKFEYRRPWEAEESLKDTKTYKIIVKE